MMFVSENLEMRFCFCKMTQVKLQTFNLSNIADGNPNS